MAIKRNQITVKQYHMDNLINEDGKLVITEKGRNIEHFYNFFIKSIETILNEKIPENTYFILKFDEIKDDDDEKLAVYEEILKNGIWLNGQRYVKSVKSPSMVRTQKTLFVRDDIAEKVMEYVSLSKIPTHAVVSKLEAAYGISLSSVLMVEAMPKIVFVKDFDKIIREDVEVIRDCEVDPTQLELIDEQIAKDKALKKAWKENKFTDDQLKQLTFYDWTNFETNKSKNQWYKVNRRIKLAEITAPTGHGEYKGNVYPIYSIEQTEEIEFPKCGSKAIGKKLHYLENHEVPMTMFDGQALGSFEWFEKVSNEIGINYITNAAQGRLPYFKGLITRFNIKQWCSEKEIKTITDVFNETHNIDDIDIIATQSCWKAYQDYSSCKKQCLFSSIAEWYELMKKYGVNSFGIANYAKNESMMKEFTPLNYQFIYALPKLTFDDLKTLSKPYEKLLYKVKEGKDVAYIKAFLQMMDNEENEYFSDKCLEMISIDERLIFDKKIQKFLRDRVTDELKNLCKGRIPVRGGYRYLIQDPIAFMEWVVYQDEDKVKGFLKTPYTVFKCGTMGEHLLMRNPTTSPKETVRATFVKSYDKYVKHLNSVIVTSCVDLLLPKFTADVDGDIALYTNESVVLNAIHDNVPLIHEGDKQFNSSGKVDFTEYNPTEIINYEKRNTSSMIGILTNWNTKFQDIALAHNDYMKADIVISTNKIYQMMLIDAAKTGENVEIAYPIQMWGRKMKKPYFMYWIYGGKRDEYNNDTKSPINQYVRHIEAEKEKIENLILKDIDFDYFQSIGNPMEIFQYRSKLPYYNYINKVVEKLKPIYKEYINERKSIGKEIKSFEDKAKMKKDPEERKSIRKKYSEINRKYKLMARKIEPNMSILATAAVELAYRIEDSYNFAWDVVYEGMKYNALQNRISYKTVLHDLGKIHTNKNITGVAEVKVGKIAINQVEISRKEIKQLETPIVKNVSIEDGKYSVLSIMGRHYAILEEENEHDEFMSHYWYDKKEESKIEPVISQKVRLLTRGKKAIDVIEKVKNQELVLKTVPDKGYANIYDEDEMVCSIAPDYIIKRGINMGMDNWKILFEEVVISVKKDQKSFTATISISQG